ncbi:HAD family phosphatase [Brachyspira sp. SAP_772]|uniref:HAD family hydrolase n=1 Tax=Brachyspira sp. SAP_772 TaxID=2608385 RepID=UPI001E3A337F|nr:HAD family phosphatase [Brachyspira sp. SAP_772]
MMVNKIELIIFDMDGLVIDSESVSINAWKRVFKNNNIIFDKDSNENDFFKNIIGSNAVYSSKYVEKIFKYKTYTDIIKEQRNEIDNIIKSDGLNVKKGAYEILDYLSSLNIKKAIASSSIRSRVNRFLNMLNIYDKFDYVLSGDEVINPKPAPDLYNKVCEYFDVEDRNNVIILEDSKNGLIAAKSAGIEKRFYIPDMFHLTESEERELSYKKFNNLLEVIKFLKEN